MLGFELIAPTDEELHGFYEGYLNKITQDVEGLSKEDFGSMVRVWMKLVHEPNDYGAKTDGFLTLKR